MSRIIIFLTLMALYILYSLLVYTSGTEAATSATSTALKGKKIFQEKNCISCHQVYGLGGYLGTDLTNSYSDPKKGPAYMEAILRSGTARMPAFDLKKHEVDALLAYFRFIDETPN